MISGVVFDGRVTRVVYDDTLQELLGSRVKFSQTAVVVCKKFISKLRNRRRNGNIVACPSSKCLWKH